MAADAIVATRRLARGLAPALLNDLGLGAAIERLCEDIAAASGLTIERRLELPAAPLPTSLTLPAYRIVQEAVTNAVRHAHASRLSVSIGVIADALAIEVADDGVGLTGTGGPRHAGLGLQGMRERALLLGGHCTIEPGEGGGVRVRATLPIRSAAKGR
jgi:signal transduction histidine kinase